MKNIDIIESAEIEETTKELNDLKKWIEKQKGPKLTRSAWRIKWPSGEETWYNMPMDTVVSYMEPYGFSKNDYWVRDDWVKMLWKYVMVAADLKIRPRGTILPTSLWEWIVCDTWSFTKSNPRQLDIAVNRWKQMWSKKKKKKRKS
jgi:hypothetical protein